ncbi:hypothetical protein [Paraburkholderia strydomiana]|uniref:hypothetical protein n=1 Tax=Paraburkholderia strydomiana TaxID=1245417 RepID=UPI00286205A8|nr:hypothetical protein [Paraburkholderia strydomiana]MDR7006655.1 hypothetical protein [Paraburkholderia strydomiana]
MGALLLAGIHPPSDCTEIPADGGIALDGTPILGVANKPFYEAGKILEQWRDWCEDRDNYPTHVTPLEFIAWCVDDQIQERYAGLCRFQWIDVFKDMAGYPGSHVPFEVALYAAKTAQPLEVILNKLNEIDRRTLKASRRVAVVSVSSGDAGQQKLTVNPHRQHLTTEELAAALDVEPQTILKGRSKNGHYCGVKATRLPNRRLAWPLDAVERITKASPTGESVNTHALRHEL